MSRNAWDSPTSKVALTKPVYLGNTNTVIGEVIWDGDAWVPEYHHPDGTTRPGKGFEDYRKAMQWVSRRHDEAVAKPAAWEVR